MSELRPKASVGWTSVNVSEVTKPHMSARTGSVGRPAHRDIKTALVVKVEAAARPQPPPGGAAPGLDPPNSRQWQDPLEDRRQADQHHEQFEKACQTAILDELIDGPKANRTDDANNQDSDQGYKHRKPPRAGVVTALGRQHP